MTICRIKDYSQSCIEQFYLQIKLYQQWLLIQHPVFCIPAHPESAVTTQSWENLSKKGAIKKIKIKKMYRVGNADCWWVIAHLRIASQEGNRDIHQLAIWHGRFHIWLYLFIMKMIMTPGWGYGLRHVWGRGEEGRPFHETGFFLDLFTRQVAGWRSYHFMMVFISIRWNAQRYDYMMIIVTSNAIIQI